MNIAEQGFTDDLHGSYRRLREQAPACPVHAGAGQEVWLITRYDEVRSLIADSRLSSQGEDEEEDGGLGLFFTPISAGMETADPPKHERLRGSIRTHFGARAVASWRPVAEEVAARLAARIVPAGKAELVEAFARPMAHEVICRFLGLSPEEVARHEGKAPTLGVAWLERLGPYLIRAARQAKVRPAEDARVLDVLVQRQQEGVISEGEALTNLVLFLSGRILVQGLIGNGMLALLEDPDQLRLLTTRPELLPSAVEELLRHAAPNEQQLGRIATEDVDVGGVTIPKGAVVSLAIAAANRDPRRFLDPEHLDITRSGTPHVAFGHGRHFCLGAHLSRVIAQVAIETLVRELPDLSLARRPQWLPRELPAQTVLHMVRELPVTFTAAGTHGETGPAPTTSPT
ncbi:cytochrome P450 [Nonomuraea ceibae]|uniref:cytochrome P450 n=1 Tax=Nonomuraea ceibae TaxID=1935170 RepID=UPI001C5CC757|nr:cytochrome P450 [Nonomuraea ceibae]